jgi:Terminase-like family.
MVAYNSEAREVWYGGAAGGGKTSLALGLALTRHQKSIIFRRSYDQLKAIITELERLSGQQFNQNQKKLNTRDGRLVELGSMQHEKDKEKYQGRPHDLIV